MNKLYIKGASSIAFDTAIPNNWLGTQILDDIRDKKLTIQEPNYDAIIPSRILRRMSRILRMSYYTAMNAMTNANLEVPDGIITGTTLGCLEDTWTFLSKMIENEEEILSPTAFIHSTHNTISTNLAIHLKCYGYNSTHVHKNMSFENALIDTFVQIELSPGSKFLVGGADEKTEISEDIISKLINYKKTNINDPINNITNQGEGTSYFILSDVKDESTNIAIKNVDIITGYGETDKENYLSEIIRGYHIDSTLILTDKQITKGILCNYQQENYLNIFGDFGTASASALFLAYYILNSIESNTDLLSNKMSAIKNIIIINSRDNQHLSHIIVEKC